MIDDSVILAAIATLGESFLLEELVLGLFGEEPKRNYWWIRKRLRGLNYHYVDGRWTKCLELVARLALPPKVKPDLAETMEKLGRSFPFKAAEEAYFGGSVGNRNKQWLREKLSELGFIYRAKDRQWIKPLLPGLK